MARYGQNFKDRAVARLLPPESAAMESVDLGAAALASAMLDEANKNAWCREHGIYPQQLE
ncbi:hypothetical protein FACS1894185_0100 [Betaproteobacteria bacterium]|nr:hypothetical protein FACS1894185_0100 [Betaproteobacteria bacterium]